MGISEIFAATLALAGANGQSMELLVPAYFYPPASWDQMTAAAQQGVPITAIMNVGNGDQTTKDDVYDTAANNLTAAGGKAIGYVASCWATVRCSDGVLRDEDKLVADSLRYGSYYSEVSGIFFDQLSSSEESLAFYRAVAQRVRAMHPNWRLVGNAGQAQVPDAFFEIFDTIVTFEGTATMYRELASDVNANKAPQQKAHMIYNTYTPDDMQQMMSLAASHNVGSIYITDQYHDPKEASPHEPPPPTAPDDNNQWNALPSYWTQEIGAL